MIKNRFEDVFIWKAFKYMIQTYPAVNLPLENKSVDIFDNTFVVLDDVKQPTNYYSGFTSAYLIVFAQSDYSTVFEFSTTGSTNTIDISNSANGVLKVYSPTLDIPAGEYLYDCHVKNSIGRKTIMLGTFTVI